MRTEEKIKRTPAKPGTRKISFGKLLLMDMKERSWLFALIGAVALVTYPIGTLLVLEGGSIQNRQNAAMQFLGLTGGYYYIFLLTAAVLAGVSGYMYLERQDQADFFMSFAVRREKYFFAPYLSGWLIPVIPYVVSMLLAVFAVCGLRGALNGALIAAAFRAMGLNILGFTAIYSVIVLAMVLTGRMLIGVLLSVFFLFYGTCATLLTSLLKDCFFDTWYDVSRGIGATVWSPVTAMYWFEASPLKGILIELAWAVPALAAAVFIYMKRPAETAENAFTFPKTAPLLKTIISVPVGLAGGLLVWAIADNGNRAAWFIAGSLIAAFIINGVIEFIIAPDIKNIARHWISGAVVLAGTLGIAMIFAYDLTGYDRWYPEKSEVRAMSVSEEFTASAFGEFAGLHYFGTYGSKSLEEVLLEQSLAENFDGIYEMAGSAVAAQDGADGRFTTLAFLYEMKNGRKVYRYYAVPDGAIRSAMQKMGSEPEFRRLSYPFGLIDPDRFNAVTVEGWRAPGDYGQSVDLTREECRELFEALKADSLKMNLLDAWEAEPLLSIAPYFSYNDYEEYAVMHEGSSLGDIVNCIYVYENYDNTLAFLEKKGLLTGDGGRTDRITSCWCWLETDEDSLKISGSTDRNTAYIADEESIEKLLGSVRRVKGPRNYGTGNMYMNITFELTTDPDHGGTYNADWYVEVLDEGALRELFREHENS